VHGNIYEWCGDSYESSAAPRPGDGLRDDGVEFTRDRVHRGGGWFLSAGRARSAIRSKLTPEKRNFNNGLRPARGITP
jgi:formylglycine-generating enzyme required for sulfatase activity